MGDKRRREKKRERRKGKIRDRGTELFEEREKLDFFFFWAYAVDNFC